MSPVIYPKKSIWRKWWPAVAIIAVAVLAGTLASWFVVPPPTMPGHVLVPALRGMAQDQATALLTERGLVLRLGEELADPGVAEGAVSWQSPVPETQLPRGSTVIVGLGAGTSPIIVPDLSNLDLPVASRIIVAAGLRVGPIDTVSDLMEAGAVLHSRPEAGSGVRQGALIAMTVSAGEPPVPIPALTGLTLREARARIEAAGFRVGEISQRSQGRPGVVVSQEPAQGSVRPRSSSIDLTVGGPR